MYVVAAYNVTVHVMSYIYSTLGMHEQRELQYSVCVCVGVCVWVSGCVFNGVSAMAAHEYMYIHVHVYPCVYTVVVHVHLLSYSFHM